MGYQKCLKRKMQMANLIATKNTGNADVLAERLGVSRRTVFRYLDELKDSGAEIDFIHELNSYVFNEQFDFVNEYLLKSFA